MLDIPFVSSKSVCFMCVTVTIFSVFTLFRLAACSVLDCLAEWETSRMYPVLYLGADAMVLHVANSFHQRQPEGSATLADYLGS